MIVSLSLKLNCTLFRNYQNTDLPYITSALENRFIFRSTRYMNSSEYWFNWQYFQTSFRIFVLYEHQQWCGWQYRWKWWWFRLHYRVCSSEDCSCRVKKWVLCVFVCFSWSRSEALRVSAASLFSADLWRISRTALPAQLLLSKGGAGELDAGRVRGHRGGSDQHRERAGRTLQPQQRPESQQSTLGRRRALRLQSNTWRSCSRDLVPQELRVLMFLQWRAAGFTAVTWFTAQYSSSLSICCHCCSFNKASERLTLCSTASLISVSFLH